MAIGLIGLLALLLWELSTGGARAFGKFGIHFLTGRDWNPVFGRSPSPWLFPWLWDWLCS